MFYKVYNLVKKTKKKEEEEAFILCLVVDRKPWGFSQPFYCASCRFFCRICFFSTGGGGGGHTIKAVCLILIATYILHMLFASLMDTNWWIVNQKQSRTLYTEVLLFHSLCVQVLLDIFDVLLFFFSFVTFWWSAHVVVVVVATLKGCVGEFRQKRISHDKQSTKRGSVQTDKRTLLGSLSPAHTRPVALQKVPRMDCTSPYSFLIRFVLFIGFLLDPLLS